MEAAGQLVRVGGEVDESIATLRVVTDTLTRDEITARLGVVPKEARARTLELRPNTWSFEVREWSSRSLDEAISEVLAALPAPGAVWDDLATDARIDMYCGLYLWKWNRGLVIEPETLVALGQRHISLGLDIYYVGAPEDEPAPAST